jgi:hypothetical protein
MIRGTKRPRVKAVEIIEPEAQKIDAKLNAAIHNRFDIEVIDAKTGEIKQRAQAENIICNALWARLFAPNTYFNYIHYGTGAGTPAATDTSLFTFLGYGTPGAADDAKEISMANSRYSYKRKIVLDENAANGATLTEVGVAHSTASSSLVTHAMLKDMNGNQISITKSDTDIINIYATIFLHFSTYDNGNIELNNFITGGSSDIGFYCENKFFGYLVGVSSDSTYRGAKYWGPTHGRAWLNNAMKAAATSYNLPAKTITVTGTRMGASDNNIGGISGIILCPFMSSNRPSSPWLYFRVGGDGYKETRIIGEAIGTGDGVTKRFSTDFGFASDATVYVDGVEETGATVNNEPLLYNNMGVYFESIVVENGVAYPAMWPAPGGGYMSISAGYKEKYYWYYNPFYEKGILSFWASRCIISVSDDLTTWVELFNSTGSETVTVPQAYRNYKYWRLTAINSTNTPSFSTLTAENLDGKDIVFNADLAPGAVITADYTTKTIAKDENHVFDLTVTIQLGEYTE